MGCSIWALASLLLSTSFEANEPTIVVAWSDAHDLLGTSGEIRSEIDSILRNAGVSVRFANRPVPGALGVTVVVTPSEPSGAGWNLRPTAMGVYLAAETSSTVFVFYNRVVRVLGYSGASKGLALPAERRDLSRAVARVAVHEIVHRLAPEMPHASDGLMQGRLTRQVLTRERVSLDESSREAVVSALTKTRRLVRAGANE
jgi:hypothetical protein